VKTSMSDVCPPYCWVEMYAGRVACCPLVSNVSHGEYVDGTDRRTDARHNRHYAFRYSFAVLTQNSSTMSKCLRQTIVYIILKI